MTLRARAIAAFTLAGSLGGRLAAQVTTPPRLGPPPSLKLPAVHESRLPNGLRLLVIPMHEVPMVQVVLSIAGGAREDGLVPGLAAFTANLLDEGAATRDAKGIGSEVAYLGASLSTSADWNGMSVALRVPKRTLGRALDLFADVALRPTFQRADVVQQRDLLLTSLTQRRDEPAVVATGVYHAIVFPEEHRYHRPLGGDSASAVALDSATVRGYYARVARPDRATLVMTGDLTLAEARFEIERRFGAWKADGTGRESHSRPAIPVTGRPTAVYLVDRPGAAQSVIRIGHRGAERSNPDYYAIQVMNTLLGGWAFASSRLYSNLAASKGYTYFAFSAFDYQPLPGAFTASADVRTDVTDSSLVEFFRELRRVRDSLVTPAELERAKRYLALRIPGSFETTSQVATQIGTLVTFGLPLTWFDDYVRRIMVVSADDVRRVARAYLHPDSIAVVIVGDVQKIEPGVRRLGLGPVTLRTP